MDNDMVLLGNIDELAEHAEAPGMVWHTATVLARKERSAVTGGMFVLKPDAAEYARAAPPVPRAQSVRARVRVRAWVRVRVRAGARASLRGVLRRPGRARTLPRRAPG